LFRRRPPDRDGFVGETDAAMLRVLVKITHKGEYDWLECSACDAGWQVPHYAVA
jgi:hypothetical protein